MAYRVVWSLKALEDVDAIAAYIYRDSASYAAAIVQKILEVTSQLSDCPASGKSVPELGEDAVKEVMAYNYRIIYHIQDQTVTITAVIHGKKLIDPLGID